MTENCVTLRRSFGRILGDQGRCSTFNVEGSRDTYTTRAKRRLQNNRQQMYQPSIGHHYFVQPFTIDPRPMLKKLQGSRTKYIVKRQLIISSIRSMHFPN